MISREQLKKTASSANLHLYQQEKDYLLKLFLFNYYNKFEEAVFKGGTCIKYLFGLNRFSEDLDFNLLNSPQKFEFQVKKTLKEIELLGIKNSFIKKEKFKEAFTCVISFQGPLFTGAKQTRNKFRVDAGKRTGILLKPEWQLIGSEYPETSQNFLIKTMNEQELLAEKLHALNSRQKGRDLFDAWFLIKKGVPINKKLLSKKIGLKQLKKINLPPKREYNRDMEKLSTRIVPFNQVRRETLAFLKKNSKERV